MCSLPRVPRPLSLPPHPAGAREPCCVSRCALPCLWPWGGVGGYGLGFPTHSQTCDGLLVKVASMSLPPKGSHLGGLERVERCAVTQALLCTPKPLPLSQKPATSWL